MLSVTHAQTQEQGIPSVPVKFLFSEGFSDFVCRFMFSTKIFFFVQYNVCVAVGVNVNAQRIVDEH